MVLLNVKPLGIADEKSGYDQHGCHVDRDGSFEMGRADIIGTERYQDQDYGWHEWSQDNAQEPPAKLDPDLDCVVSIGIIVIGLDKKVLQVQKMSIDKYYKITPMDAMLVSWTTYSLMLTAPSNKKSPLDNLTRCLELPLTTKLALHLWVSKG